jgi:hypothetical protein
MLSFILVMLLIGSFSLASDNKESTPGLTNPQARTLEDQKSPSSPAAQPNPGLIITAPNALPPLLSRYKTTKRTTADPEQGPPWEGDYFGLAIARAVTEGMNGQEVRPPVTGAWRIKSQEYL